MISLNHRLPERLFPVRNPLLRPALALLLLAALGLAVRAGEEDSVREAFTAFQNAVKAGDPDKIWATLDKGSRDSAEETAKTLKDAYENANAKDKARLEKQFGLTAAEMEKLTGKIYLKSKRFLGKYDEVPGSTIEKITVEGDKATVAYKEADGDKEKMALVKQDGKWKISVKVV
jgi:hypothetical protein